MAMAISSGIPQTLPFSSMLSRDQLFHLFNRFSQLTSLSDVKKRIADAVRDDNQEAVAVTTAIQEEIFSEMGVDAGFGISCLGKVSSYYENDHELMVHFYKFVAIGWKLNVLFIQQLEMLQHMRKLHSYDQSAILEKLHQQLESVEFDSSASILTENILASLAISKLISSICGHLTR